MSSSSESQARKALTRLRRALEKTRLEVAEFAGALRHAEGSDFPEADFASVSEHLMAVETFIDEQGARIEDKILSRGGLEPGRIRRG